MLACLLIGALVFGYMVSTIGTLMAGIDRHQAANQERVDQIKDYTRCRKSPTGRYADP